MEYRDVVYMLMQTQKKENPLRFSYVLTWALTDSNRRPSACKADALNQLS